MITPKGLGCLNENSVFVIAWLSFNLTSFGPLLNKFDEEKFKKENSEWLTAEWNRESNLKQGKSR